MSYTATLIKSMGLSGGDAIRTYEVTPDSSNGNMTISDVTAAYVMGVVPLVEAPAANAQVCVRALEDTTTLNKINFYLYQATNSLAASFKKFRVTVKVES